MQKVWSHLELTESPNLTENFDFYISPLLLWKHGC